GLRVVIEGKFEDVPNAEEVVLGDARKRVSGGIAHIAAAIIYPKVLRTTPTTKIIEILKKCELKYRIVAETHESDWLKGSPRSLMDALRRAQEALTKDDIVEKTAKSLSMRLEGVAELWMGQAGACDRLYRIYHWLLHYAKYLGTYYTAVPSATLLLKLALAADWKRDFGDPRKLSEFKVADLACGTGTLLMAAAQAFADVYIRFRAAKGRFVRHEGFIDPSQGSDGKYALRLRRAAFGSASHRSDLSVARPRSCISKNEFVRDAIGNGSGTTATWKSRFFDGK